jgi:3-oxoacyl-[acyl-carrier-protein] synthase-3
VNTIISGTGSALPSKVVTNKYFEQNEFYGKDGIKMEKDPSEIVLKLQNITGIKERRHILDDQDSVPIMVEASRNAIESAGIDKNDLSGIIVAHNAGNMVPGIEGFHPVPNLAAHLKHGLEIDNPEMYAYDILFGCPGWLQAMIQAHQAIKNGDATHVLVVGLEVASRMLDPHDVDSMIFADGCGATVISADEAEVIKGIRSYATFSHARHDLYNIYLDGSNNPDLPGHTYVKMNGREVYKYATTWLPQVIKKAMDKGGFKISDVDMFLFHQANEKMLHAIAYNIAGMYEEDDLNFDGKIPMTIDKLGNTSVATIPTMMDLILRGRLEGYSIKKGDLVVFASVGAGMHCNALVYQF